MLVFIFIFFVKSTLDLEIFEVDFLRGVVSLIFDKWLPILRKGTRKSFDLDIKKPTDPWPKRKKRTILKTTLYSRSRSR